MHTIKTLISLFSNKTTCLFLATMLTLGSVAHSQLVISITESGSDLVVSSNGSSLDLTGLSSSQSSVWNNGGFFPGWIGLYYGIMQAPFPSTLDYSGGTFSKSVGWTDSELFDYCTLSLTSGTLPHLVFSSDGNLTIPNTFSSGDTVSAFSATLADNSYQSLGLTAGEYAIYTWDSGSVKLQTIAEAVPEPSTYAAIFGALAFGAVIYRRKRR